MKLLTERQSHNLTHGLRTAPSWPDMEGLLKRVKADWTDAVDGKRLVAYALTNTHIPDVAQRIVQNGGRITSDDVVEIFGRYGGQSDQPEISARIQDVVDSGWDPKSPTSSGASVWVASGSGVDLMAWAMFQKLGVSPVGQDESGKTLLHHVAKSYNSEAGLIEALGRMAQQVGLGLVGKAAVGILGMAAGAASSELRQEKRRNTQLTRWFDILHAAGVDPLLRDTQDMTAFSHFNTDQFVFEMEVGAVVERKQLTGGISLMGYLSSGAIPWHHQAAYPPDIVRAISHWEDVCHVDYLDRSSLEQIVVDAYAGVVPAGGNTLHHPTPRAKPKMGWKR